MHDARLTTNPAAPVTLTGTAFITTPARKRENEMDATESIRRAMVADINTEPDEREALEAAHGQIWDTGQMRADFDAIGFMAPFIVVKRKSDGAKGSLTFQHSPRYYFDFVVD